MIDRYGKALLIRAVHCSRGTNKRNGMERTISNKVWICPVLMAGHRSCGTIVLLRKQTEQNEQLKKNGTRPALLLINMD